MARYLLDLVERGERSLRIEALRNISEFKKRMAENVNVKKRINLAKK